MIEMTAVCVYFGHIWQYFLSLSKFYVTVITEERFPAEKAKLVWEASLRCRTFL